MDCSRCDPPQGQQRQGVTESRGKFVADGWRFPDLVSRFRSSYHFSEPRFELRNRKDTSKPIDLVWLWFRSPHEEPAAPSGADFRTSTPEASSSAVVVGIVVTGIGACLARGAPKMILESCERIGGPVADIGHGNPGVDIMLRRVDVAVTHRSAVRDGHVERKLQHRDDRVPAQLW